MSIPISTYKRAYEEEGELENLKYEYEAIQNKPDNEKYRWLDEKMAGAGYDAQGWIEDAMLYLHEDLVKKYEDMIVQALGEDIEYYEDTNAEPHEETRRMVAGLVEESGPVDEEGSVQKIVSDIRSEYGAEVERLKAEEQEGRKEYEETRDIVRHMETPETREQVEFTTEPHELENIPYEQNLGAAGHTKRQLVALANRLDEQGLYKEASEIDAIIILAEENSQTIYFQVFKMLGTTSIEVKVFHVQGDKTFFTDEKYFDEAKHNSKEDIEQRRQAAAYIKQLQQKYPGARVRE